MPCGTVAKVRRHSPRTAARVLGALTCVPLRAAAFLVLSEPRALWMRIVVPLLRPDRAMQVRLAARPSQHAAPRLAGLTRADAVRVPRAAARAFLASSKWA